MKRFKKYLVLMLLLFCVEKVNAATDDIWYTNDNGISFSKLEYDFISEFYYDGFQDYIDYELYNVIFIDNDVVYSDIDIVGNSNYIMPFSNFYQTVSKKLYISSSCTSSCLISISVEWLKSPIVRSYDVIGAYLKGVSLSTIPRTKVINSTDSKTISTYNLDGAGRGFGASIMLLPNGNDMKIIQTFRVTGSGKIYGSYQHATSNVTLAQSQNYSISTFGYGGVFLFSNSVRNYYDGMSGVNIDI